MAIKRIQIKQHTRKGLKNRPYVRTHPRIINIQRKPKLTIMDSLLRTFSQHHVPISAGEISRRWSMNLLTTKNYLMILEVQGKIRKKIIEGKVYWERV